MRIRGSEMSQHGASSILKFAYIEMAGIMALVVTIAWACIVGNIVVGATSVVILPFWTAAGFIGLSFAAKKRSASHDDPARSPQRKSTSTSNSPAWSFQTVGAASID